MDNHSDFVGLIEDFAKVSSSQAYLKVIEDLAASGHFIMPSEERTLELARMFMMAFAGAFAGHIVSNRDLMKGLLFPTPDEDSPIPRFSS